MTGARTCRCGCECTPRPGSKYKQGHDRRHIERLAREYKSATGVEREAVEIEATRTLTRPLFIEYLRRTGDAR